MTEITNLKVALLVAPGIAGLLFGGIELGTAATPFTVGFVLLVAYAAALTFGRLIIVGLLRRGIDLLVAAILAGAISAALPVLLVGQILQMLAAEGWHNWLQGLLDSLVFPAQVGGYGALGGLFER